VKTNKKQFGIQLGLELVVYALLVGGYFFLVQRFLGDWLYELFAEKRRSYAAVAVLLMLGQGVVLELVTSFLLGLLERKSSR